MVRQKKQTMQEGAPREGGAVSTTHQVMTPADFGLKEKAFEACSPVSFSTCIQVLRQNWRQGTVACKGRSDVAFSNKKPFKQKGTGRARAGSPRSPIWRKGGVTFGPQERTRVLKVSKQEKLGIFQTLLWDRLANKQIVALDLQHAGERTKTAMAAATLKQAGLAGKKVALFVAPHDYQTQASFANIPEVNLYLFDQPNAYALAQGNFWVYLKKDDELFKRMVGVWMEN